MKILIEKDKKRRVLYKKYEIKKLILKYIIFNQNLSLYYRQYAQYVLNSFPLDSIKPRIHNRCVLTGRAKGIYRKFRLSRIMFKFYGLNGLIPGLKKSSW